MAYAPEIVQSGDPAATPFVDKNGRVIFIGDRLRRLSPDHRGVITEWVNIVGHGKWCNGVMEDPFTYEGYYILGVPGSPGSSWYGELTKELASMSEVLPLHP